MEWREEYKNALLDISKHPRDIRRILKSYIPQFLYKYGSFDSPYWEKTVIKGEIYLSPAKKFNDPFDCRPNFDYQKAISKGKLRKILLKRFPDRSFESISQKEITQYVIDGLREDVFVSCFSEIWDSLLMWAHYANNYNGFCIKYDFSEVSERVKDNLYPVLYESKYIDITQNLISSNDNTGLICNLAKEKEWSYEKEWRIVKYKRDPIYFRKHIKAIYIGNRCNKENKDKVLKWANEKGVTVYNIIPAKSEYKLEAYEIKDETGLNNS